MKYCPNWLFNVKLNFRVQEYLDQLSTTYELNSYGYTAYTRLAIFEVEHSNGVACVNASARTPQLITRPNREIAVAKAEVVAYTTEIQELRKCWNRRQHSNLIEVEFRWLLYVPVRSRLQQITI